MATQSTSGRSGHFPLDNISYDLITIIHEKSKALEAYDTYMQDVQSDQQLGQLLQEIRQQDEQCIQKLQQHLTRTLGQQGGTGQQGGQGATSGQGGNAMGTAGT